MVKPKRKSTSVARKKSKLRLRREKKIVGIFNGHAVTVPDLESMIYLHEAGNFGKGNLSKGEPSYNIKKDDIPKLILQHQFENQTKWSSSTCFQSKILKECVKHDFKLSHQSLDTFLQSAFSDSEQKSWKSWKDNHKHFKGCQSVNRINDSQKVDFLQEHSTDDAAFKDEYFIDIVNDILALKRLKEPNFFHPKTEEVIVLDTSFNPHVSDLGIVNAKARFEKMAFMTVENLNLNLEEAFFLKSVLGCLNIVDLDFSEISVPDLWEKFSSVNKNFLERYITYHYYRAKGWVVKSGLKFGGDYLLYKDGPAYYHASYLVKILDRRKKLTWREFLSMNRLVETFNKDVIVSNVLPTKMSDKTSYPDVIKNHAVQEVLVKRWFPSKERSSKGTTFQSGKVLYSNAYGELVKCRNFDEMSRACQMLLPRQPGNYYATFQLKKTCKSMYSE